MLKFIKFLLVVTGFQILVALIIGFIAYEMGEYDSALCLAATALLSYITYSYLDEIVKFINANSKE